MFSHEKLPLVINIGEIKTSSINLKVKFAGLESLLFEDLCKVNIPQTKLSAVANETSTTAASNQTSTASKNKGNIFQGRDKSKENSDACSTAAAVLPSLKVIEADELNTELGRMEVSSSNHDDFCSIVKHDKDKENRTPVEESIIEFA